MAGSCCWQQRGAVPTSAKKEAEAARSRGRPGYTGSGPWLAQVASFIRHNFFVAQISLLHKYWLRQATNGYFLLELILFSPCSCVHLKLMDCLLEKITFFLALLWLIESY